MTVYHEFPVSEAARACDAHQFKKMYDSLFLVKFCKEAGVPMPKFDFKLTPAEKRELIDTLVGANKKY